MEYPGTGSAFGRYDIGDSLGQGGMGLVFRAVHRDLDRPVALKLLSPTLLATPSHRERFLREARVLARLDSPYVVRVHDAGDEDGWLFIATELVEGGDAQRLIDQRGAMPPGLALRLVAEAAQGLAAAHAAGVLHRDLKPSNVLVRRREDGVLNAVLCDLGIAKAASDDGLTTTGLIGTPTYMAPERHDGGPASEASDLYELGCVLHAFLTGRPPYQGTWGQVAVAHLQAPVPRLPDGHPAADAVGPLLDRLLAKDPSQRPGSAAELARAAGALAERLRDVPPPVPGADPDHTALRPGTTPTPSTPSPASVPTALPVPSEPTAPSAPSASSASSAPPPASVASTPTPTGESDPPRRRARTALVAAVVGVLLLASAGAALAVVLGGNDPTDPGAQPSAGATDDGATDDGATDDGAGTSAGPGEESSAQRGPFGPGLPAVGECRVLTSGDLEPAVNGTEPVPCDRAGVTARTIHVGYLDQRDSGVVDDLAAECLPLLADELGVEPYDVEASLAATLVYWPSDEQWASGARWWRCDAAMVSQDRLAPLPTDLSIVYEAGKPLPGYRACLDLERQRVLCENSASYFEYVEVVVLDEPDAFPGDAEVNALAAEQCPPVTGGDWYATWASAATWERDRGFITCWRPLN